MDYGLIGLLLFCIILIIVIIKLNKDKNQLNNSLNEIKGAKKGELEQYFKEEVKAYKERTELEKKSIRAETDSEVKEIRYKSLNQITELENKINSLESELKEKEKRYNEVNQDLELYRKGKIKEIDSASEEYEKRKRLIVDASIVNYREVRTNIYNQELNSLYEQKELKLEELNQIQLELEEERSRRAAINEELRRQEEKEKYNEIHSVNLSQEEKDDIHFLLSLENKLHNKQILYKLVWSTYLQQAYKNTFHNILGNRDPKNVIYCIENINTGKKYIGKTSAEVSKRWTEHIKTSLNIGTIKTTNIHKALYNHWDEFIFYIITETDKEKLSETEKYYIQFYESDKYGYNIKAGG